MNGRCQTWITSFVTDFFLCCFRTDFARLGEFGLSEFVSTECPSSHDFVVDFDRVDFFFDTSGFSVDLGSSDFCLIFFSSGFIGDGAESDFG